jgi:hypothetical protein
MRVEPMVTNERPSERVPARVYAPTELDERGGLALLRRRRRNRPDRPLLCVAATALLLLGIGACGGTGGSNGVIVHVGSMPISKGSLERWRALEVAATQNQRTRGPGTRHALSALIGANQLLSEAASRHLAASAGEAEARLQELEFDRARSLKFEPAARFAPFAKLLPAAIRSRSAELLLLRLDATVGKVERALYSQAERALTRAQVARYYASHTAKYALPERRVLEVIGNYQRSVIMDAKRKIEKGANFLAIARRVSIDQEAPNGLEPPLARGEEEPEYDRVVFPAKRGLLYGPYKQAFFFIFKVIKITPRRQLSLASSEAAVRRDIVREREQPIMASFYRAMETHWTRLTGCSPGYVVPRCRQYRGTESAAATHVAGRRWPSLLSRTATAQGETKERGRTK